MKSKTEIAQIMRKVSDLIDSMSESDFEHLHNGGHLELVVSETRKSKNRLSEASKMSVDEMSQLIEQLQSCKSRDEARQILRQDPRASLKDNLTRIAKMLKIHVNKHDRREALEDKVVESVIGVKLRSESILGLNLKAS